MTWWAERVINGVNGFLVPLNDFEGCQPGLNLIRDPSLHQNFPKGRDVWLKNDSTSIVTLTTSSIIIIISCPAGRKMAKRNGRSDRTRVLVMGGLSFIGSRLCRALLKQGYSVRIFDIRFLPGRSFDVSMNVLSSKRLESETGWTPKVSLYEEIFRNINRMVSQLTKNMTKIGPCHHPLL
jgi:hypothetical protein